MDFFAGLVLIVAVVSSPLTCQASDTPTAANSQIVSSGPATSLPETRSLGSLWREYGSMPEGEDRRKFYEKLCGLEAAQDKIRREQREEERRQWEEQRRQREEQERQKEVKIKESEAIIEKYRDTKSGYIVAPGLDFRWLYFEGVNFKDANLAGCDFTGTTFGPNCTLMYANFRKTILRGVKFERGPDECSKCKHINFGEADLRGVGQLPGDLYGAYIGGVITDPGSNPFEHSNLVDRSMHYGKR